MIKPQSLTLHLIGWSLGALLAVWAGFIVAGYFTGVHEADELTDGHLASVALLQLVQDSVAQPALRLRENPPGRPDLKAHDYQRSLSVVVWDTSGRVLSRSGDAPLPSFSATEGFETLQLGNPPVAWRSFSRWDEPAHEKKVMVLLSVSERDDLAQDIAGQMVEPGFWLLPFTALALGLAIRRGLKPLYALSRDVDALDIDQPAPLAHPYPQQELRAVADSINTLTQRYHAVLRRERDLTNELAHELRTPLTSITLQARALRGPKADAQRETMLQRLERDALSAGQVLSDLLALARASRTELAERVQALDLDTIARSVVAEFAQAAHLSGHELALSSPGPFALTGHPVLLGLALRNLIENALSHTPGGSRIDVQLDPDARWLQVCDDAGQHARMPAHTAIHALADPSTESKPKSNVLGLGLGHRVVQKIAGIHGGQFAQVPPPPGYKRCYRVVFQNANAGACRAKNLA